MRLMGHMICTIFILIFVSFSGYSIPNDKQLQLAESLLNRIGNVNQLDLEFVLQQHIAQYEAATNPNVKAMELEIILGYAVHIENLDQIIHFSNLQAELGEELDDPIILTMAKANLAFAKSLDGEFQTAYKEITILGHDALTSSNLKLQIHSAMLKGLMANAIGRTLESIEMLKAVERDIVDKPQYDMQRMLLYWTIAYNAVSDNDLETAIKYYSLSADLAETKNWAIDSSSTIYNIAILLSNAKAYDSAEKYLYKYGEISQAVGRESDVFFMYYGLARLYMDQERYSDVLIAAQSAQVFEDIQVGFQPYLYIATIKALARLNRVDEAKNSYEKFVKFFDDNPEYNDTRDKINLVNMEAEILYAEGKLSQAYDKYINFHDQMIAKMSIDHTDDAKGMRQGLEAAIAKEEAEKKMAQSEIFNTYMLLGASLIIFMGLYQITSSSYL